MYIFVLIYTPKSRRYYIISRQITNTLIPNNLERIVLLYLQLQFPLSAISLRFAARIPPQSGLRDYSFFSLRGTWQFILCERNPVKRGNLLFFNRKGRKDLRKVRKVFNELN